MPDLPTFTPPAAELSAAGEARRARMKAQLVGVVQRRRRRRATFRAGAMAAVALLAVAVWWRSQRPLVLPSPANDQPEQFAMHSASFEVVRDRPERIARVFVAGGPLPSTTWLSDEEMLDLAAAAARPVGMIRTGGKCMLTAKICDDSFE